MFLSDFEQLVKLSAPIESVGHYTLRVGFANLWQRLGVVSMSKEITPDGQEYYQFKFPEHAPDRNFDPYRILVQDFFKVSVKSFYRRVLKFKKFQIDQWTVWEEQKIIREMFRRDEARQRIRDAIKFKWKHSIAIYQELYPEMYLEVLNEENVIKEMFNE